MKRVIFIFAMLMTLGLLGVNAQKAPKASKAQKKEQKKASASKQEVVLVAYFSATGNTEKLARKIATEKNATLYEITPATRYTSEDLDWHNKKSRSSIEMENEKARPNMKGNVKNLAKYTTVYLGYPIWWGVCPRIINTFIDANPGLRGKVIIPFATSGSSTIDKSVDELRNTYPALTIKDGIKIQH